MVDPEAMISFVDQDLALRNGWRIHPCKGSIKQAMSGSDLPQLGEIRDLELLNGNKRLMVTLEVGNLSGEEEVILGLNLFEPLGYQLRNIPILLPTVNSDSTERKKETQEVAKNINDELMEYGINEEGIPEEWKKILKDNMELPISSTCLLP